MPPGFVLVHRPVVGPATWQPVAVLAVHSNAGLFAPAIADALDPDRLRAASASSTPHGPAHRPRSSSRRWANWPTLTACCPWSTWFAVDTLAGLLSDLAVRERVTA